VERDIDGHWRQWVDACIAGYGTAELSSPFEDYAGPLTETVLTGNLLIGSFNIRKEIKRMDPVYGEMTGYDYPGRYKAFEWDGENMKISNFEPASQFIKRNYKTGWGELKL
jgi:hypothetical protein